MKIQIGYWIEKESRKLTQHTSYAADAVEHETKVGKYPLTLVFEGGFNIPMPYWICFGIDSRVVGGGYYSGFGGVNYGFTPAEKVDSKYVFQMYAYQLEEMVKNGTVELNDNAKFADYKNNPTSWSAIKALVA